MENGIDININTVYEMIDFCKFAGLDVKEYLGDLRLAPKKNDSSYH